MLKVLRLVVGTVLMLCTFVGYAAIDASADVVAERQHAAATFTVVRNDIGTLPIHDLDTTTIAIVNLGNNADNIFSEYCLKYAYADLYASSGTRFNRAMIKQILSHDIVIVGIYADKTKVGSVMSQFAKAKNVIPVFFINATEIAAFGSQLRNTPTLAITYDTSSSREEYAAQGLFGGIAVSGHLSTTISGVAQCGDGVTLPKTRLGFALPTMCGMSDSLGIRIDSIVAEGLREKAFPGCQVLVAKDGNIVIDRSYGSLTSDAYEPVLTSSLYDLASVSKATGTLSGIMKAYDQRLFDLNDKASKYIPGLRDTDKADITVRELLYHESGMAAAISTNSIILINDSITGTPRLRSDLTSDRASSQFPYEAAKGIFVGQETFDTIMSRIYHSPLRPTKKYNYSCLNFALLMDMEQRLTGIAHDRYVNDNIFAPIGAYHTGYRPLTFNTVENIAATEYDPIARRQVIRGYVHDEMAAMSGGVQGNAGLFANAEDIAKLCQMWLNGGSYGGKQILSSETVRLFTTDKSPSCRRGLGFDKPDTTDPSASPIPAEASPATFGHIGFTGTCFWVDPEHRLIYIFLSNRVNPTRNNPAFSRLNIRPTLLRAIYQSL